MSKNNKEETKETNLEEMKEYNLLNYTTIKIVLIKVKKKIIIQIIRLEK